MSMKLRTFMQFIAVESPAAGVALALTVDRSDSERYLPDGRGFVLPLTVQSRRLMLQRGSHSYRADSEPTHVGRASTYEAR